MTQTPHYVYLGLGSNLGDRHENIARALTFLGERAGEVTAVARHFETEPQGFQSPNPFLNTACRLTTTLTAAQLLDVTQQIERELGRTEKTQDGEYHDRTIDIDILLSETEKGGPDVLGADLTLPHPHLLERDFVLLPLSDIDRHLRIDTGDGIHFVYPNEALANLEGPYIEELVCLPQGDEQAFTDRFNALLRQLSETAESVGVEDLKRLIANEHTHVYCVYDEGHKFCGMGTLCMTDAPTGKKCWVEDVVVDAAARCNGYGSALMKRLKLYAYLMGAKSLNLTSRPERVAANKLYSILGFSARKTNVYRYNLPKT